MLGNADILELPCSPRAGDPAAIGREEAAPSAGQRRIPAVGEPCFHCGTPCGESLYSAEEKLFCCRGCLTVYEILTENGLSDFYTLSQAAGVRGGGAADQARFQFVDEPAVRQRLVDFSNEQITRVTFHVPAIHCIACVWLLENLFRLKPGLGQCQVQFPRKEVAISFQTQGIALSEVVALLASLGYEPDLKLSDLNPRAHSAGSRRIWLQLGIAGFVFGNTMLFSIASYLGLDSASGPAFRHLTGLISLFLALPVVFYSASNYWKSAWISLRQRTLNIDVPIAAGILALFAQSTYEIVSGRGAGYFDSLAGLLFFLLCGKLFQRKTFDRLAFDRDYRSFFPLSVARRRGSTEERVSLSEVGVGDQLLVRNGELVPADATLLHGPALIDYSFVTGESEPVAKVPGDYLYAGGRQVAGEIEVEVVKPVSQGYLTSLWNQEAFLKPDKNESLDTLTNRYSQRFTKLVIGIAVGAALFWLMRTPALSVKAFVSVLIVACPCALALAAPFSLGTALRVLARRNIFLKSPAVIERLAQADAIVFDKTGTLTSGAGSIAFVGTDLTASEKARLGAVARQSTHPLARRLARALAPAGELEAVTSFQEIAGAGMQASVAGSRISMGAARWLESLALARPSETAKCLDRPESSPEPSAQVHVSIDGAYRGCFLLRPSARPGLESLIANLRRNYQLALLSGDGDQERPRFARLFGTAGDNLHFHQSPLDKLAFIQRLQEQGRRVVMVGDGLNDAGALRQSDVGIAVVEQMSAFSPASDAIMAAEMASSLDTTIEFARQVVRVVRASFLISALYNVVGIGIAASGQLSPVVCAVLMPLSSITVVVFGCGLTNWIGRRLLPSPV